MNAPILALAALLSAAPQSEAPKGPFEGYLVYKVQSMQPDGSRSGELKMGLSPTALRTDTTFNNNGKLVKNVTLVNGDPPVIKVWNEQTKSLMPMQPPPPTVRGAIKAERLEEGTHLGLKTVHVRIMDGPDPVDFWTAPGLVSEPQMKWMFAASRVPEAVVSELKRVGAWGPVVKSVRDSVLLQLDRLERVKLSPELFSDTAGPGK